MSPKLNYHKNWIVEQDFQLQEFGTDIRGLVFTFLFWPIIDNLVDGWDNPKVNQDYIFK